MGRTTFAEPEKALLDWFYLERKRGSWAHHRRVRLPQARSREASVVRAKISTTCKVRTAWVVGSYWCGSSEWEIVHFAWNQKL